MTEQRDDSMTIDCVTCGHHAALRVEMGAYLTTWACSRCGCRFQFINGRTVIRTAGRITPAPTPDSSEETDPRDEIDLAIEVYVDQCISGTQSSQMEAKANIWTRIDALLPLSIVEDRSIAQRIEDGDWPTEALVDAAFEGYWSVKPVNGIAPHPNDQMRAALIAAAREEGK